MQGKSRLRSAGRNVPSRLLKRFDVPDVDLPGATSSGPFKERRDSFDSAPDLVIDFIEGKGNRTGGKIGADLLFCR
jgi:hypothetical protein